MLLDFVVIIPTYNEEKTISKTLQLIRNQKTRATFEIAVVDGGSTDRTVQIAKKYAKVFRSPRKGKAYQLNYAAAQINSKYLIFLDADTHIPNNYIDRIQSAFKKDPELWACSGHIFYTGVELKSYYFLILAQAMFDFSEFAFFHVIWFLLQRLPNARFKLLHKYYFFNLAMFIYYTFRQLFGSPEFSGSNICVRRTIFEEIGGFRQPPRLGVDWLFCHVLRHHIRKKGHGKMKLIHSLIVETNARHLSLKRAFERIKVSQGK
ncbi:MAG TPA: glycosyltransferase [Candidatus Deferrimicrobium sp.]|nr:glycosyltransferase [Candidatus Deferrimicrobium sp.]